MFSKKGFKLLEEPTAETSYGSVSKPGPSTEKEGKNKTQMPEITSSTSADLATSKDASRHLKPHNRGTLDGINGSRNKLVICSSPESSSEIMGTLDDQTTDHADGQQTTFQQEVDVSPNTCSILYNFYKNGAIKLRNSFFIHIFQVLFSLIPISGIVMGILLRDKCKKVERLPTYGILIGFLGLVFTGHWMYISYYRRHGRYSSDTCNKLFRFFLVAFSIAVIQDMTIFGRLAYSYEEGKTDCSKTFYYYAFYKQIVTGSSAILATLLYLPGSLRYFSCH